MRFSLQVAVAASHQLTVGQPLEPRRLLSHCTAGYSVPASDDVCCTCSLQSNMLSLMLRAEVHIWLCFKVQSRCGIPSKLTFFTTPTVQHTGCWQHFVKLSMVCEANHQQHPLSDEDMRCHQQYVLLPGARPLIIRDNLAQTHRQPHTQQ